MTKQKLLAKSGMNTAAAEVKNPPLMPGGYAAAAATAISSAKKKKLVENLEIKGGTRIWVESMRASSPTSHRISAETLATFMGQHPSALNVFDEITKASKGKQIVMFLD